jgi:hypothetical protein
MATAQAVLTPTTDTTPAVVSIPAKELSGAQWVNRFPGSASLDDCTAPFKGNIKAFISALEAAGATVTINATLRPPERAYMFHWSHKIVKKDIDTSTIPDMAGVNINWTHPTKEASVAAAQAMVDGFGIGGQTATPALNSRHTQGAAIDMNVSWSGNLSIKNARGDVVEIKTTPRSGMNEELHEIGATYSVIKFNVPNLTDRPHWSDTGT